MLTLFLVFNSNTYIDYSLSWGLKKIIYLIAFLNTFLIPLIFSLVLVKRGVIQSLSMRTKEERIFPFLFASIFYFFTYYLLTEIPIPPIICKMVLAASVSVFLSILISLKWKISIHMIGAGGALGAILSLSYLLEADLQGVIILLILFSGLLGFARLKLNEHLPSQVYAGFFLGLFLQLFILIGLPIS